VKVTDPKTGAREYVAGNVTADQIAQGERRRMDCTDCHNRPSHAIAPTPERAVDLAISRREIPVTLPFVRREAVNALKTTYPSEAAALGGISRALRDFYKDQEAAAESGRGAEVERAVGALQNIYRRSVFPEMKVSFGTYANNIGHIDAPGCFRCHDEEHVTKDGKKLSQDCEICHAIE
jgi:hypothetical protein